MPTQPKNLQETNDTPSFRRKSVSDELQLLLSDDPNFTNTADYITPLITSVLDRFSLTPVQYRELYAGLMIDVPIAASRYLHNKRDITGAYAFSTYFTWFISERINAGGYEKKEPTKKGEH